MDPDEDKWQSIVWDWLDATEDQRLDYWGQFHRALVRQDGRKITYTVNDGGPVVILPRIEKAKR